MTPAERDALEAMAAEWVRALLARSEPPTPSQPLLYQGSDWCSDCEGGLEVTPCTRCGATRYEGQARMMTTSRWVAVHDASSEPTTPESARESEPVFIVGDRRRQPNVRIDPTPEPAFGPCIEWDADADWRPVDERPRVLERVLRSRKRHGQRFLTQHTRDHYGVPLHEPIRTITTKDQWALVDGDVQRRLTIRENARAMGFRDSYKWPKRATRTQIMCGLGNAVPPPVACELCEQVAS